MKKVCVIGNFSGRNAGDAAILEGLLSDVFALNNDTRFLIPTINSSFVRRTYNRFPVCPVPLMPWNLSLKIFGLPLFMAVLQSDLVLVTDAILFDRKLANPFYNYLSTMAIALPLAKKHNIPVVLYNVNLGPVKTKLGRQCMRRVLESSDRVIVRDRESIQMLKTQHLTCNNLIEGADCALNVQPSPASRLQQIKDKEGILGEKDIYMSFNISSYLDVFVKGRGRRIGIDQFISIISQTLDLIMTEMGKKIIMPITQPMDLKIAGEVLNKTRNGRNITLVSNKTYSHNDIAAILSDVEIHVGMRTHSLILATANCTPTIGIIATPKNRGYMQSIGQDERMIEFGESFTVSNFLHLIEKTWQNKAAIREELKPIIAREKAKASSSSQYVKAFLA